MNSNIYLKNCTPFVDLDGVLADYEKHFLKVFGLDCNSMSDAEAFRIICERFPNDADWFAQLPKTECADILMETLRPYNPLILTATGRNYVEVTKAKKQWVQKNFNISPNRVLTVPKSKFKSHFATPFTLLIDDSPKSVIPFRENGGIAILHDYDNPQRTLEAIRALENGMYFEQEFKRPDYDASTHR